MKKMCKLILPLLCLSSCLVACNDSKDDKKTNEEVEIVIDNNEKSTFKFTVESLELLVGDSFTLSPKSYYSTEGLTWYSSAKKIVSIDKNGTLQALQQGTAIISAYDSIAVGSISVTVTAPNNKLSISVSPNQLTLGIGDNYACRVLPTVTVDGKIDSTIVPDVLIKETSDSDVVSFSKQGEYYRFVGRKVGNVVYSFTVTQGETTIGANLYITVKDVK